MASVLIYKAGKIAPTLLVCCRSERRQSRQRYLARGGTWHADMVKKNVTSVADSSRVLLTLFCFIQTLSMLLSSILGIIF